MTARPHPQARRVLAAEGGGWTEPDVAVERDRMRAAAARDRGPALEHVADVDAAGVPARLYRPAEGARTVLYVHGGGWVFHDLQTHDAFCRHLAARTGWALLAVDYRRAPEHPYPTPLDDVETAARWLRDHGGELGVDSSTVVGLGDSAGGNLVAGLCVRDPGLLDAQVLLYPVTDAAPPATASAGDADDIAAMDWYWAAYAPGAAASAPDVSVLRAPHLAEHPPALVVTAEHDVLAEQGEAYAAALAEAGVPVLGLRAIGMVHGFWRRPEDFDASAALVAMVAGLLPDLPALGRAAP